MTQYWSVLVKQLSPYVPGEQRAGKNIVKLNTNENPYPPSPAVIEAIANVDGNSIRRYPNASADELCEVLANYHGLKRNQVFVANGSDEILALAFMAFFTGSKPLQYPNISYSFYPVYCDLLNIAKNEIPLKDNFEIDLNLFEDTGAGVVFPNPNAPTAMAVEHNAIATLLARLSNSLVLIDEAYTDFGAESAVDLIDKHANLLVTQTFSKGRSMAGLRLGVALGNEQLIEALNRVKNSFNSYPVDVVAQAAGIASIKDDAYYRDATAMVIKTRNSCIEQLQQRGFEVLPSAANFVFAKPSKFSASDLFEHLNKRGIMVRYWSNHNLRDWLRITIGTDEEMRQLIVGIDAMDS